MHRQRSALIVQRQNSLPKVKLKKHVSGERGSATEREKKKELHVRLSNCFWK